MMADASMLANHAWMQSRYASMLANQASMQNITPSRRFEASMQILMLRFNMRAACTSQQVFILKYKWIGGDHFTSNPPLVCAI